MDFAMFGGQVACSGLLPPAPAQGGGRRRPRARQRRRALPVMIVVPVGHERVSDALPLTVIVRVTTVVHRAHRWGVLIFGVFSVAAVARHEPVVESLRRPRLLPPDAS